MFSYVLQRTQKDKGEYIIKLREGAQQKGVVCPGKCYANFELHVTFEEKMEKISVLVSFHMSVYFTTNVNMSVYFTTSFHMSVHLHTSHLLHLCIHFFEQDIFSHVLQKLHEKKYPLLVTCQL